MGLLAPFRGRARLAGGFLGLLVLGAACGDPEAAREADQASIQASLEAYAPRLADAYAVADLEALAAYAAERPTSDPEVQALLERHADLAALPLRERLDAILAGAAVEKEIAGLDKRVRDLLAEGRTIRPVSRSLQVESIETWRHVNAFATTVEVWDLRVYAAGTDVKLSETLEQRNRVKYQLQREGERWLVLFRELEATFE